MPLTRRIRKSYKKRNNRSTKRNRRIMDVDEGEDVGEDGGEDVDVDEGEDVDVDEGEAT